VGRAHVGFGPDFVCLTLNSRRVGQGPRTSVPDPFQTLRIPPVDGPISGLGGSLSGVVSLRIVRTGSGFRGASPRRSEEARGGRLVYEGEEPVLEVAQCRILRLLDVEAGAR
jgi:hypothetical protein